MFETGLKIWSTNKNYLKPATQLYQDHYFDYIELYVVPNSYTTHAQLWKNLAIPIILHAPHGAHGFNLAKESHQAQNLSHFSEVQLFADLLNAKLIVTHPGTNGDIKETVRQLNLIKDSRIIIENKPYYNLMDKTEICNGSTLTDLKFLLTHTSLPFCLDIGHAICSANAQQLDPIQYIKSLLTLNPKLFHLSDGDYHGILDRHDNLTKGNFPLVDILRLLPPTARLSIETEKASPTNLDSFKSDIIILSELYESAFPHQ